MLAPASRSRCATRRTSVPVPPVTRIDVVMTSPFTAGRNGVGIPTTRAPSLATVNRPDPRPCRSWASRWQCSASRQAANWLDPAANRKAPGSMIRLPSDTGRPGGSALIGACAGRPPADGCAGRSVCIYNPDLDPGRHGANAIISYITQAITASSQPAHYGRALIRRSVLEWTKASVPMANGPVASTMSGRRRLLRFGPGSGRALARRFGLGRDPCCPGA
jgi:hypothetical protein